MNNAVRKVFEFMTHKYIGLDKRVDVWTLIRYIGVLPIAFDLVILRYLPGSELPMHKDEVPGLNCYRFNFSYNSGTGGELICDNTILRTKFLNIFRPDLNSHGVRKVENGTRWVFTIGIGLKNNTPI